MGIFIEKQDSTINTSSMYFDSPINKSESLVKAKAPIKQGDMVRWNSSGGPATGKVTRIVAEGVIDVPDSKFKIKAEKDNPAVLINLYRAGKKTDIFVGHKMSTLKLSSMRKAEDLEKAEDDMNMVHQDAIMGGKKKKVMNAYGIEVEVDDDEEEIIMEDDKVEMGMGGYGYGMPKKKVEVLKHADHDQSTHGSWAGDGGGSSGGGSGSGNKPRPIKSDVFESKMGSVQTTAGTLDKLLGKGKIVKGDEFERKVTTQWNFEMKNPTTGKNFKASVYDFMRYDALNMTAEAGKKLPPFKSSDRFNFSIAAPNRSDATVVSNYILSNSTGLSYFGEGLGEGFSATQGMTPFNP